VASQNQPGVHHREPAAVSSPKDVRACGGPVASCIYLTGELKLGTHGVAVVVRVNEVVAPGVIWRVDVDQLDLIVVCLLQELEDLQVVPLDEDVTSSLVLVVTFRDQRRPARRE